MAIDTRVILPCWAPMDVEMQVEAGCEYSVFMELNGSKLLSLVLNYYRDIADRAEFVVVLPETAPNLESETVSGYELKTIRLAKSKSIGDTIASALGQTENIKNLIINMPDTIVRGVYESSLTDRLLVKPRADLYRWTSFERNKDGSIKVFNDRLAVKSNTTKNASIGVFAFSDIDLFRLRLNDALSLPNASLDPLFVAIEKYSEMVHLAMHEPSAWFDCGHVDTFYAALLEFQSLRYFNHLEYDHDFGLVTKRSQNTEAFRHQVRWYKQVPNEASPFLPRIFDCSDEKDPFITMELVSSPTLSSLFLTKRLPTSSWGEIARKILLINNIFKKYKIHSNLAKNLAAEIYIEKTKRRINQFCAQNPFGKKLKVFLPHGQSFSLNDVLLTLDSFVEKSGLLNINELSPVHGDLCFSNILYDHRTGGMKLIDPRGEFGVPGIYGDSRYDLAKLMHSYQFGYDLIMNRSIRATVDTSFVLKHDRNSNEIFDEIAGVFNSFLFEDIGLYEQCKAINALLFLSMLPLHDDHPERQMAMASVGLSLYAEIWDQQANALKVASI